MKCLYKVIILSVFASLLYIVACNEENENRIKVNINKGILEELESTRPKEMVVFEIIPGNPNKTIENSLDALNIKGNIKEKKGLLYVTEGDHYLEVRKISNAVFFGDMAHLWKEQPTPQKTLFSVPDNVEATKTALAFLNKFGFNSKKARNLDIDISNETFELTLPGGNKHPISVVVGKNIQFRRKINNLTVYGPGSKIKIYIGENGSINGFMSVWRQIDPNSDLFCHEPGKAEPTRMHKVRPIEAIKAFEALKKNPLDHLPLALVYRINIENVRFGYYSRAASDPQTYLQPVYVFTGIAYAKLPGDKQVEVPYEQFVAALEKPFESIWPETEAFKPEPREMTEMPKSRNDEDEKVER